MTDAGARFGDAALGEILSNYGLDGDRVDEFHVLPQKNRNQSARLVIGDEAWMIKRYPGGKVPGNLLRAHWFQLQLQSSAVPVASLALTSEGKTTLSLGSDIYSVQQWVDGKLIDYASTEISAAAIESLAANLAVMHRVGRELYEQHRTSATGRNPLQGPAEYVARIHRSRLLQIPRMVLLELKPFKSAFDLWVVETHRRLVPKAEQIAVADGSGLMDYCYIHNDMYWGNFVYDADDQLRAFIDFDKVEVGSWLYEVGCAAALCATSGENVQRFVKAYELEAGASLDLDAMVLAMYAKTMRSALWCVHAHINRRASDRAWLSGWGAHLERCLAGIEEYTFDR